MLNDTGHNDGHMCEAGHSCSIRMDTLILTLGPNGSLWFHRSGHLNRTCLGVAMYVCQETITIPLLQIIVHQGTVTFPLPVVCSPETLG